MHRYDSRKYYRDGKFIAASFVCRHCDNEEFYYGKQALDEWVEQAE